MADHNHFILLGAGSDVASRYVFPALVELESAHLLPQDFQVLAVTRKKWRNVAVFRRHIEGQVKARHGKIKRTALKQLLARVSHASADLTDPQQLRAVIGPLQDPLVLYFGLPPSVSEAIVENLHDVRLPPQSRVMLEKPFGQDRESAQSLNRKLLELFPEQDVFRVDHFLGKQTVQNILGIRFANRVLDSAWDRQHVERVEIVWDETNTLEGRVGYYDSAGALKDMIQNHLLQLMCLVAMEPPSCLTESELRDRKMDLLRDIRSLSRDEIKGCTIRARYTNGNIKGRPVRDYLKEPGVDPARQTETFADIRLFVDNERWRDVPFILRSGKAMKQDRQELTIYFRPSRHSTFGSSHAVKSNQLRVGLKVDQVGLSINVNGPGNPLEADSVDLQTELAPEPMSAYAGLIQDVLKGESIFFIRNDEAEEAWRVVDPIVEAWKDDVVPLESYRAGTHGPQK
ncbi:MAG: glucose-6-phosphate dehydrogenase [Nitrospira sp.]|nr:glucose-6-phosphate dehydrogenase [Nitrospira sp.]MDR4469766.1 glucose-6-phosphate dehydrogenase [Nitrospira sp.]